MIYLYIYLALGFIIFLKELKEVLNTQVDKYPFLKPSYLRSLPKNIQGRIQLLMATSILGVITVVTLILVELLWVPLSIEYIIKGVTRK